MTEPLDPNEPAAYEPPAYSPPPPYGGQPSGPQPGGPQPGDGQSWGAGSGGSWGAPAPSGGQQWGAPAAPSGGQQWPAAPQPGGPQWEAAPQPGGQQWPGSGTAPQGAPGTPSWGSPGGYPPAGAPAGGWVGPDGVWVPVGTPPPQSHGRRTALIVAVVLVLLAGAGVGAYFALRGDNNNSSSSAKHSYTVPASFNGYTQLHNAAATQVESSMRSLGQSAGGGVAKNFFDAASIGVYSHNTGDQPVLITIVVPTSATGTTKSPDEIASGLLQGVSASTSTYPSGSHGGTTRCGEAPFGTVTETMCAWSDHNASGMLVSVNESMSPAALAQLAQKFRDKVE